MSVSTIFNLPEETNKVAVQTHVRYALVFVNSSGLTWIKHMGTFAYVYGILKAIRLYTKPAIHAIIELNERFLPNRILHTVSVSEYMAFEIRTGRIIDNLTTVIKPDHEFPKFVFDEILDADAKSAKTLYESESEEEEDDDNEEDDGNDDDSEGEF